MKTASISLTIAIFSSVAFAPAAARPAPINATYTCDKGQVLQVVFDGDKAIVTTKTGRPMTLKQATTADGFKYKDATHSLRGKGDNATWTKAGYKPVNCTSRRLR